MLSALPLDRLCFPIVTTGDELLIAKTEEHPNVHVHCSCGRHFVTSIGNADKIITGGQCLCIAPKAEEEFVHPDNQDYATRL